MNFYGKIKQLCGMYAGTRSEKRLFLVWDQHIYVFILQLCIITLSPSTKYMVTAYL